MPRTYNPQSVVELPRLDQKAGLAVGTATVHAAKGEKKLAPNVAAALQGVTYALTGLQAAHDAPPPPPESGAGEQRRAESAAWAGVENWLAGLKALHGTPLAATAQHLHEVLFPNGLLFVREQTERHWSETDQRLRQIRADAALKDAFVQLGGAAVIEHLQALHDATGKAAYITVSKPSGEAPPVRARLDALKAALRTYVLQVVANRALDASPAAADLAAKLLQPLLDYEPPKGKSGGASRPAGEGEEDHAHGGSART